VLAARSEIASKKQVRSQVPSNEDGLKPVACGLPPRRKGLDTPSRSSGRPAKRIDRARKEIVEASKIGQ
jgi:hypothetical protein